MPSHSLTVVHDEGPSPAERGEERDVPGLGHEVVEHLAGADRPTAGLSKGISKYDWIFKDEIVLGFGSMHDVLYVNSLSKNVQIALKALVNVKIF